MVFHQNIETHIQFLFPVISVFIRIQVLKYTGTRWSQQNYFAEDIACIFERMRLFFKKKIRQKRNFWQNVLSVTFVSSDIYCGVSKSTSYFKLLDYSISYMYHRGLTPTIGRRRNHHTLESYICFNIRLCKCIIWLSMITKFFLIWQNFGDTCHVLLNQLCPI